MQNAEALPAPRRSIAIPMFAVVIATVLAALFAQRLGHDPHETDTSAVLPFGG